MNKLACYFSSLNCFFRLRYTSPFLELSDLKQDTAPSVSVSVSGSDIKALDLLLQQVNFWLSGESLTSPPSQACPRATTFLLFIHQDVRLKEQRNVLCIQSVGWVN